MPQIYLNPWVWRTTAQGSSWTEPSSDKSDYLGCLDLRTIPQMSAAGTGTGYGLFIYGSTRTGMDTDLGSYANKADLASAPLNQAGRNRIESKLGLPNGSITATTLLDAIIQVLTTLSDPTGQTACKGLLPELDGVIRLHLGGFSPVYERRYTHTDFPHVLDHEHETYRQYVSEIKQGLRAEDFHRRYLTVLMEKYKTKEWEAFVPAGHQKESPLPHSTTITDDFNRADNTNISTGAPFSWTEVTNDWQIVSNQLVLQTTASASDARADSDLSTTDMECGCTVVSLNTPASTKSINGGTTIRFAAAARTFYSVQLEKVGGGGDAVITRKMVAGTPTDLFTTTSITYAANDTCKIKAVGSTLTVYRNGVVQTNNGGTDTSITTNTRGGVIGFIDGTASARDTKLDDWSAADVAIVQGYRYINRDGGHRPRPFAPGLAR